MIRCIRSEYVSSGENDGRTVWMEAAGLSTDQKPSENIVTGSKFLEVDTGKEYAYDEIGEEWYEMANGGSSGGSFSPDISNPQDGDTLVYNATQQKWVNGAPSGGGIYKVSADSLGALNKTYKEIRDQMADGNLVVVLIIDEGVASTYCAVTARDEEYIIEFDGQGTVYAQATGENAYPVMNY